jgi:hypothetical protein
LREGPSWVMKRFPVWISIRTPEPDGLGQRKTHHTNDTLLTVEWQSPEGERNRRILAIRASPGRAGGSAPRPSRSLVESVLRTWLPTPGITEGRIFRLVSR